MTSKSDLRRYDALVTRVYAPRGGNTCAIDGCAADYYGSGFCKKHHQWHWKRSLLPKATEISIKDKLLARIKIDPVSGCWIWQRAVNNKGYGTISLPGQVRAYAHRVSYEVFVGSLPPGMDICHTCDTPPCICPDHLFPGTHTDNMRDCMAKGRNARDSETGRYRGKQI